MRPFIIATLFDLSAVSISHGNDRVIVPAGPVVEAPALLQYAVYLVRGLDRSPKEAATALLKAKYKTLSLVDKPDPKKKCVFIQVVDHVREAYRPPDLQSLKYYGKGVSKEEAKLLQECRKALIVSFSIPEKEISSGILAASKFILEVARKTKGVLWDEDTRQCFGIDTWRAQRTRGLENGYLDIKDHITIHAYKDGAYIRAITLGMSKFGLPDIEVSDFSWSESRSVGNLINLFAQQIYESGKIEKPGQFTLAPRKLGHQPVRESVLGNLYKNAQDSVVIKIQKGIQDEGDPKNRIIEVVFENYEGNDKRERMEVMLSKLWGWKDELTHVKHNKEILEASERARKKIPSIRKQILNGLAPGEYVLFKAPFTTPDGSKEWMWVEVLAWDSPNEITGILKNQPYNIPELKAGMEVKIKTSDVFDYIHRLPTGETEGNETGKLIQKYSK